MREGRQKEKREGRGRKNEEGRVRKCTVRRGGGEEEEGSDRGSEGENMGG